MISKVLVSFAFLAVANGGLLHEGLQVAQEPAPLPALPAEPLAFQQFAAPLPAQPIGIPGWEQPPVPLQSESIVGIEKNILKTVHVPYPVDKYVKVDREVQVPVPRYVRVDRPYEVVKYIQKPYIVNVPRLVHVPFVTRVHVPHPVVQVEPVLPEPTRIVKEHVHIAQPHYLPPPVPEYLPPSH